jgi:hypothetical protein
VSQPSSQKLDLRQDMVLFQTHLLKDLLKDLADFKLTATDTTEELQLRTSCKLDAYISQRPPLAGGLFLSK